MIDGRRFALSILLKQVSRPYFLDIFYTGVGWCFLKTKFMNIKKMRKKGLNLLLLLWSLALLLSGCAHKPAPADSRLYQSRPIIIASSDQIVSDAGVESDFDEDFFEDEFEEDKVQIADPLAPLNKVMFHFNDKLYFWLLKPLARAYKAVTPEMLRIGVKNFFRNLETPIRLANCILQGKGEAAGREFARFVMNTTLGVFGLGSPADDQPGLQPPDEEDLGQTFAVYGAGNGFYIVWPVIGPSTLRDSIGMVGDHFLHPVSYVEPEEAELGLKGFDKVNQTSFRIGDYEALKKAAIDPYVALRNVYLQFRAKKVLK